MLTPPATRVAWFTCESINTTPLKQWIITDKTSGSPVSPRLLPGCLTSKGFGHTVDLQGVMLPLIDAFFIRLSGKSRRASPAMPVNTTARAEGDRASPVRMPVGSAMESNTIDSRQSDKDKRNSRANKLIPVKLPPILKREGDGTLPRPLLPPPSPAVPSPSHSRRSVSPKKGAR